MIEELLSGFIPLGNRALNTQKINKNIEKLSSHDWFKELYNNETYRKVFLFNRVIRRYLESDRKVDKLVHNLKKREQFLKLLHEQMTAAKPN